MDKPKSKLTEKEISKLVKMKTKQVNSDKIITKKTNDKG